MVRDRLIGGLLALFVAILPAGPAAADVDRAGDIGARMPGPAPMRAAGPRAPAAVTGVRVTAVGGGLRISWRPAGDFGSGTFVSYLAVTSDLGYRCAVTTATGTGCELRGLQNGRNYHVAVLTVATNGTGLSGFATGTPANRLGGPPALAPGGAGGVPMTGAGPLMMGTVGFLLIGLGLSALLVRRAG